MLIIQASSYVDRPQRRDGGPKVYGGRAAKFMQDQLNVKFGDELLRHLQQCHPKTVPDQLYAFRRSSYRFKAIDLTANANPNSAAKQSSATVSTMVAAMQAQIDVIIGANKITVGYDYAQREFKFTPANSGDVIATKAGVAGSNARLGSRRPKPHRLDGFYGQTVTPNGALQRLLLSNDTESRSNMMEPLKSSRFHQAPR